MFAAVPMFAFPSAESLARFGLNCLAVAGGFLIGYVGGGVVVWALNKWVFADKSPAVVKKLVRLVTGVIVAILVALVVFGSGGSGPGGGGPDGSNTNKAGTPDDGKATDPPAVPPVVKPPPTPEGKKKDGAQYDVLTVTFLGGDAVQGDLFYKLDDSAPLSFAQLKAAVLDRKKAATLPLKLERVFLDDPRSKIDKDSINVRQVEAWAAGQGIKTP